MIPFLRIPPRSDSAWFTHDHTNEVRTLHRRAELRRHFRYLAYCLLCVLAALGAAAILSSTNTPHGLALLILCAWSYFAWRLLTRP